MRRRIAHWLCPDDFARARMLENSERIARARLITGVGIAITLVVFAPLYGWWTLLLFAIAFANMQTLDARIARSAFPELHIAGSLVSMQAVVALAVALSGGPTSPIMAWMVLPTAFAAVRFRGTLVIASVAQGTLMLGAATVAVDPRGFLDDPGGLLSVIAAMASITAVVHTLNASDTEHREGAILDPLTGLLNRTSLERRFAELAEQAALTGSAVSLVALDLDHFKAINDRYGHARGDEVLREVAYVLRKHLRSFELIYRLGGEELLVVLPGVDEAGAADVAERLRRQITAARPAGLPVTASFGVAQADGPDFAATFAAADAALYRAKADGRDRVRVASSAVGVGAGVGGAHAGGGQDEPRGVGVEAA